MHILARKNAKGFFSGAIRFFSRSIYSHVELVANGAMPVSSSEQDKGVRWAPWISGNPEKWDRYEVIDVTNEEDLVVWKWCHLQIGKKYDWRGIFQYAFPHIRNKSGDLDRWYCSEFVQAAIAQIRPELKKHVPKSPGNMIKLLLELKLIRKVA